MATPETEENIQKEAQAEKAMVGSDAPPPPPPAEGNAPDSNAVQGTLPSFKEESYLEADLKDSEKKALQELKMKIEEGIKANAFVIPKIAETVKDSSPELGKEADKEAGETETLEAAMAKGSNTEAMPAETVADAAGGSSEEPAAAEKDGAEMVSVTPAVAVADAPPSESATTAANEVAIDEDVSLWGVPLLHTKGDRRTDVVLLKFLRARDSKVDNSFSMLKHTLLWRKKFGAESILEEDFGSDFDGVAFLHGVDRKGHPVSYNIFGSLSDKDLYQKAFGDEAKTQTFLRWRVQLLEKSIHLLNFNPGGANALIQLIDLKNSPWPAKKELRTFINQALNLLQDNYPELVVKNVLINVPWYFSALFSIISPFLTQRTKSKFVLIRGGKVTEELFKLIAPEQIPVQYGGLSRMNDEDFGSGEAPVTELSVKAGQKQTVEIKVHEEGATVLWDLAVIGWDVSYGAEFVPDLQSGYTTIIEKTKKIISQEQPMRNSFTAMEAGKVVLTIDNTLSKKKKNAVYRYLIKPPAPATELPN